MNMSEVLAKYTTEFFEFVKAGASAVGKEVPLYVDELIRYEIVRNAFYVIALLICMIAITVITYKLVKLGWKLTKELNDFGYPVMIIPFLIAAIAIPMLMIVFAESSTDLIKVSVAPRVYIVEKIQEMIKK